MSDPTIEIDRRFCGPPTSGNGGYVAGRLAAFVEAPAVAVRLSRPPPLERPLSIERKDGRVRMLDEGLVVAEARPCALDLEPPPSPGWDAAVSAAKAFRGFDDHVFPRCFVCGPQRREGDGLRIFPGPSGDTGDFAAPWRPDASLADGDTGRVAEAFLWAALDCPGCFSFPQPAVNIVLLGELSARLFRPVEVGERCVLTSWEIGHQGRKHLTGSAIFGADGFCCGYATGLWIEVAPEAVPHD